MNDRIGQQTITLVKMIKEEYKYYLLSWGSNLNEKSWFLICIYISMSNCDDAVIPVFDRTVFLI